MNNKDAPMITGNTAQYLAEVNGSNTGISAHGLFGRQPEVTRLHDVFSQYTGQGKNHELDTLAASSGTSQLVILQGPSGVGKRTLARTLQPLVAARDGFFISACFPANPKGTNEFSDQQLKSLFQPLCSVFLQAMTNLFYSTTDEVWSALVSSSFLEQFFSNPSDLELLLEILTQFSNSRELSTGRHESQIEVQAKEQRVAISYPHFLLSGCLGPRSTSSIIARFLGVVSTLYPCMLLLENAHCADTESLEALDRLLQDFAVSTKGLLIVLSCRDDSVSSEALVGFLSRVSKCTDYDDRIHTFNLENLSRQNVHDWIIDVLTLRDDSIPEITDAVHQLSSGNPQLIRYILVLIKMDMMESVTALEAVDALKSRWPNEYLALFQLILSKQDVLVRRMVEKVICLRECDGREDITVPLLETVLQMPCSSAVVAAKECGLVESHNGRLMLANHELQEAAYSLLPEAKRAQIHLLLGRRLWKNSSLSMQDVMENDVDATLLHVIAQHLRRGMDLVTDVEERKMIVAIHWKAGKEAVQSAAFSHAVAHFEDAIAAMGDNRWGGEQYDTILTLHNCATEAYYCVGDFVNMDRMLDTVFRNAANFQDKLQAYITLVFANGARHRIHDALATAFDVLDKLNEPIQRNPSKMLIVVEYVKTRRRLQGKNDRFFSSLPHATDPSKIAAMTMLNFTSTHLLLEKPEYAALAIFRLIRLVMDYGITSSAPIAFSGYGMAMLFSERIDEGYRYGQIALAILDMVESKAWMPRTYMMVHGRINIWVNPFRESIGPLRLAQRTALRSGDIEGSVHAASNVHLVTFYSGAALSVVEPEVCACYDLMESLGQTAGLVFLLQQRDFFSGLAGKSRGDEVSIRNYITRTSAFNLAEQEGNKMFVMYIHFYRMIQQTHIGEYADAVDSARNVRTFFKGSHFLVDFYEGLASIAHTREYATGCGRTQRNIRSLAQRNLQRMARYSAICPANFRNKCALLRAEVEALRGRANRAIELYNESIKAASEEGFIQEEGLAYDRLAQFHCFVGEPHLAGPLFTCARDAYSRWGANILVEHIDDLCRHNAHNAKQTLSPKAG